MVPRMISRAARGLAGRRASRRKPAVGRSRELARPHFFTQAASDSRAPYGCSPAGQPRGSKKTPARSRRTFASSRKWRRVLGEVDRIIAPRHGIFIG